MLSFLVTVLLFSTWYLWNRTRHWTKQGIPTPSGAHWIFGHLIRLEEENEIARTLENMHHELDDTDTFGLDLSGRKFLVTSNVDLLKEVHIKNFEKMHGRSADIYRVDASAVAGLASSHGAKWQRIRSIMEPAFTTEEVKNYEYQIMCVVDEFMKNVDEVPNGIEYDYKPMIVKAVVQNAFQFSVGIIHPWEYDSAVQSVEVYGRDMFERRPLMETPLRLWMSVINGFTDAGRYVIPFLNKYLIESRQRMFDEVKVILDAEKKKIENDENTEYSALVYMLDKEGDVKKDETVDELKFRAKFEKKLTPIEIWMNTSTLLVTASVTTHVLTTLSVQQLAKHPRVQEKLYRELKERFPKKELITFDELAKIDYLEWVMREVQRYSASGIWAHMRMVTEKCTIGNGIQLYPGDGVMTNTRVLSRREEFFGENTEEFRPERWDPKHPYHKNRPTVAFIPFGVGPRICPGRNLATMTFKALMTRILLDYQIYETPKTSNRTCGVAGTWIPSAYIRMERRNNNNN